MTVEDKLLIQNLAHTADIINTINGGMSQASFLMSKEEHEWTVRIKVPGVDADNMRIELKDDQMYVFQILGDNNSSKIKLPYLLTTFKISNRVNFDAILAEYDNGEIFIHLPFDEMGDSYERQIDIIRR